jgi:hypothetical protein
MEMIGGILQSFLLLQPLHGAYEKYKYCTFAIYLSTLKQKKKRVLDHGGKNTSMLG